MNELPTFTYPKIASAFKRDPDNNYKTFLLGEWTRPEFEYLQDLAWHATEKVDGTNCRIHITGQDYHVGGRTVNAQLHIDLARHLCDIGERAVDAGTLTGLTLFGEGYGAGIQKGGSYRKDKSFILFDVAVTEGGLFLEQPNVREIAHALGIPFAPVMTSAITLNQAVERFANRAFIYSHLRDTQAEGWVLRPTTELCNRLGGRIIVKLKGKDFPKESTDA